MSLLEKMFCARPNDDYLDLDNKMYFEAFGIHKNNDGEYKAKKKKRVKRALERAWLNRDFEIKLFWSRATFFWGFIVAIGFAYSEVVSLITPKIELEFLILCLALIFSTGWYFVLKGSKNWQQNWELHIDKLEDFISGPIYKTIRYDGPFYSVSNITELVSISVIGFWSLLVIRFLVYELCWIECCSKPNWFVISISVFTLILISSMRLGYAHKKYNNTERKFIRRSI